MIALGAAEQPLLHANESGEVHRPEEVTAQASPGWFFTAEGMGWSLLLGQWPHVIPMHKYVDMLSPPCCQLNYPLVCEGDHWVEIIDLAVCDDIPTSALSVSSCVVTAV